jgi:hypothetical protein
VLVEEIGLPGGFVADAVRVGDTVRKAAAPVFVRRLLDFFEERGWAGAPRFLGSDGSGRDVLSFVPGEVPWRDDAPPLPDAAVAGVARLVREFHDLTTGTELAAGGEVVCHHDLSPKNTVLRGGVPVALLDWDLAGPGLRVHDVAHVCWQFAPLSPAAGVQEAARRVRVVVEAYGCGPGPVEVGPVEVGEAVLWWQDRCWRGIEAQAREGVVAMVRLRDLGVVQRVRECFEWTAEHRGRLFAQG